MINFDVIEGQKEAWRHQFLAAQPFPHIVIDNFCNYERLSKLYSEIPLPRKSQKTGDFVFAKSKFEVANFKDFSETFRELYRDLVSKRFEHLIGYITNEEVFVDPVFYGGGLHQGGEGSYLDMHADFNYHPHHPRWFRNLNLLLYLNKDWKKEYGGELKLMHSETHERKEIDIPFNRFVIMLDRGFTLHGYDRISFPRGTFRRTLATYAYSLHDKPVEKPRTTLWTVGANQPVKWFIARLAPAIVRLKNRLPGYKGPKTS